MKLTSLNSVQSWKNILDKSQINLPNSTLSLDRFCDLK